VQAVVLNLCFDYPATRLLGVENHVCELQLVVRGIHTVQVRPARAAIGLRFCWAVLASMKRFPLYLSCFGDGILG
jgi:hypothetical protein